MSDCLRLVCDVEEDGEKREMVYEYDDLKTLQSKLTLVAADKQRENRDAIRKFNEVCEDIQRFFTCKTFYMKSL